MVAAKLRETPLPPSEGRRRRRVSMAGRSQSQVHMGNPQSKAAEQMISSDVPADQMEGTNVDDYNLQPVAHDIDEIYPSSPGMSLCGYSNHNFMLLM